MDRRNNSEDRERSASVDSASSRFSTESSRRERRLEQEARAAAAQITERAQKAKRELEEQEQIALELLVREKKLDNEKKKLELDQKQRELFLLRCRTTAPPRLPLDLAQLGAIPFHVPPPTLPPALRAPSPLPVPPPAPFAQISQAPPPGIRRATPAARHQQTPPIVQPPQARKRAVCKSEAEKLQDELSTEPGPSSRSDRRNKRAKND